MLYFPVSALVTLFGNIIQNPLDPRARSDARLMNVVVSFLSTLGVEAETGGVHRMLAVCTEFERIAKLVIDKSEKENAGRRKRKNNESASGGNSGRTGGASTGSVSGPSGGTGPGSTPTPSSGAHTPTPYRPTTANGGGQLSPHAQHSNYATPMTNPGGMSQHSSPSVAPSSWPPANDFAGNGGGGGPGQPMEALEFTNFAEMTGFTPDLRQGQVPGSYFTQPHLPPDLYSLPVSLDWDWAEMSGGAYPSFENGAAPHLGGGMGGNMHHPPR